MQDVSARVRVFNLAAATSIFSFAAIATATPVGIYSPETQAMIAALQSESETPTLDPGSIEIATAVDTVTVGRAPKGDRGQIRMIYAASVEGLPSSGQLTTFEIAQPHDARTPALGFTARAASSPGEQIAYSRFVKPADKAEARVAAARLPRSKARSPALSGSPRHAADSATVLAYAPQRSALEAPFDAVMNGPRVSIPDDGVYRPRPRPADAVVDTWLDGRSPKQFDPDQHSWVQNPLPEGVHDDKQQKCLAEGIYFEARGESALGQAAVAQVILNRVRAPAYPDTICGVVYQNKSWRNRCQFSFACDGISDRVRSGSAWRSAVEVANKVTDGEIWLEDVGDSTHYHANYVRPRWGKKMIKADRIGAHIFYRTKLGGWS